MRRGSVSVLTMTVFPLPSTVSPGNTQSILGGWETISCIPKN